MLPPGTDVGGRLLRLWPSRVEVFPSSAAGCIRSPIPAVASGVGWQSRKAEIHRGGVPHAIGCRELQPGADHPSGGTSAGG